MKENQISQVKEFSGFLCLHRYRSLGSLKSFLWYTPQLSGASILCFLILTFLRVHSWWVGGCRGWLLDGGHPVSILSSFRAHHQGGCNVMTWWLQHPLFTDMAGDIFSLLLTKNTCSKVWKGPEHRSFCPCGVGVHHLPSIWMCSPPRSSLNPVV